MYKDKIIELCIFHIDEKDNRIQELQAEIKRLKNGFGHGVLVELEQVDSLKDEVKELQAELQSVNDDYNNDHKVHNEYEDGLLAEIKELKAENKRLNDKDGLYDEVKELQAENKKLMTENIKLNSECWCGCNDDLRAEHMEIINDNKKLKAEVKELKAEIKAYINAREGRINTINDLNKINDRLMQQVNSKWSNNSNVHTISGEIAEYMSHNEKCGGARLFLIPRDEFKNDEYDNTIYWDDGIE